MNGLFDLIAEIVDAADVPDEVKISREARKRARKIGLLAKRIKWSLQIIESVTPAQEQRIQARLAGWRAELDVLTRI